jgi:antitoxin (DNA-binding transcriptional repressor) of toxin-antitoxin stability system
MNMRDATFTELRNQAKHYFDLVEAGEIVRVLRNGKPIAEIHPIARDLPSWKQRRARPLAIPGQSISRLILEDRGDE